MAKMKRMIWMFVLAVVILSIYLTGTMFLFEMFDITPHTIPFGVVGWTLIVELPRAFIGLLIIWGLLRR